MDSTLIEACMIWAREMALEHVDYFVLLHRFAQLENVLKMMGIHGIIFTQHTTLTTSNEFVIKSLREMTDIMNLIADDYLYHISQGQ